MSTPAADCQLAAGLDRNLSNRPPAVQIDCQRAGLIASGPQVAEDIRTGRYAVVARYHCWQLGSKPTPAADRQRAAGLDGNLSRLQYATCAHRQCHQNEPNPRELIQPAVLTSTGSKHTAVKLQHERIQSAF